MTLQEYVLHLSNGDVVKEYEDYEKNTEYDLIHRYLMADNDDLIRIGDSLRGYCYIPKKNIVYFHQGDVVS